MIRSQYVYVLERITVEGSQLKIGESHSGLSGLKQRFKDLNGSGNLPDEWKPILLLNTSESKKVEKIFHQLLEEKQVSSKREIFKVPIEQVREIAELLVRQEILKCTIVSLDVLSEPRPMTYAERKKFLREAIHHPNVLTFANGRVEIDKPILFDPDDIHKDELTFQMGRTESLDSIPFIPYDPESPTSEHLEIQEYLSKVYPDLEIREHVMTIFSSCLEGVNRERKIYIMSGEAGNGKTSILKLLSLTFGEYHESLQTTLLTTAKKTDNLRWTSHLRDKRIVTILNTERDCVLNKSRLGQLLDDTGTDFHATFKLFIETTTIPHISVVDRDMAESIYVIPHYNTFVHESVSTYPIDSLLDSKFIQWRAYFAGMLTWYYEHRYLTGSLLNTIPTRIIQATKQYIEEAEPFMKFCHECLIRERGVEVQTEHILSRYYEWSSMNLMEPILEKKILTKLTDMYGPPKKDGLIYVGVYIA